MRVVELIKVSEIYVDRHPINQSTLSLVDYIRNGGRVPPIKVYRNENGRFVVKDGRHRICAHKLLGRKFIKAKFYKKGTRKMKNKKVKRTDLTLVIDRSLSMARLSEGVVKGYRDAISEQKSLGGKCRVTVLLFNHNVEVVTKNKKIKNVSEKLNYVPAGTTALFDAIARAISMADERISRAKKKPKRVMILVNTDGYENASRETSRTGLRELIEERKSKGWDFVFLGARFDAFGEARSIGISRDTTVKTVADPKVVYQGMSVAIGSYRQGASAHHAVYQARSIAGDDQDKDSSGG